ncbi:MAG: hypothetical protein FWC83_00495 [Alphaproteobacteria bacterium]|nr:hypothetical protein [Alphaproteobacteria bacterium]
MKKILTFALCSLLFALCAEGTTVVATVNNVPITDADITARIRVMNAMGERGTDNRHRALNHIIEDNIRLGHTAQLQIMPTDAEVNSELDAMRARGLDTSGLNPVGMNVLRNALRSNIAWQMMIGRVLMPTVNITDEDLEFELNEISRTRGLPVNVEIIRLVGIPENIAARLTTPENCTDAVRIARSHGGEPIRLTVPEFELSEDIRTRIVGLSELTWSPRESGSVLLVCSRTPMPGQEDIDNIVRQNAMWRRAMFLGEQQLNQLRRRAVIVVHDERYRGAI